MKRKIVAQKKNRNSEVKDDADYMTLEIIEENNHEH